MESSPRLRMKSLPWLRIPVYFSQAPSHIMDVLGLLLCLLAALFSECIRVSWKGPGNWDFGGFD
jgi:hypothetical protein